MIISKYKIKPNISGYTLVELLLVISMAGMVMTMSLPAYHSIRASVGLENSAQEVVDAMRQAQQKAVSSNGGMAHGVHFYADSYASFGDCFDSPAYLVSHQLPYGLEFSAGAGTTVLFSRHNGQAAPALVTLSAGGGDDIGIRVNPSGSIDLE